eukprot:CAMPEP_0168324094 /NCGR_PEP_ID=MMETSP0213-20121227/3876_1 /TAXON_ID=151035 /ORGANISM="Euplotes harpa, Strain FSP1.4" /LENGTH=120 /DNA_ID=CAMNT_0008326299 /DNA_START=284 /DNA_END=646 /DNA_ORIENTATION=+
MAYKGLAYVYEQPKEESEERLDKRNKKFLQKYKKLVALDSKDPIVIRVLKIKGSEESFELKKSVSIGSDILDGITDKDIKKIRFIFLNCRVKRLKFDIKQIRTFPELFELLMERFIKKIK